MIDSVYLDTCALNRLTDDLSQSRVRHEAVAVGRILDAVLSRKVEWVTSKVVRGELEKNKDITRRVDSLRLLTLANRTMSPTAAMFARAKEFANTISELDALHLAICEQSEVDWLLTTDDRFLRQAARLNLAHLQALNPVEWVQRRQPWLLQTQT